ncbi:MAG: cupin domain-containing protein [Thermoplasmata archaeon]|nr:cupin domain-containing protein [Thermoplasmata archaeon]
MTAAGKVLVLGPGQGTEFRIGPDRFRTKGDPSQRSTEFSVIEYEGAPGVPGPPPHVHRSFDEVWYVLEGEVTFVTESKQLEVGPGSYVRVPRGVPHTFRVTGKRPARWIGIFSPGKYVGLVEELGKVVPLTGPPNYAALRRLFAKYDSEILG